MHSRSQPIRVGFVVHLMQMAGAERLVAETIARLGDRIAPVVFCLDARGLLADDLEAQHVPVVVLGRRPGIDLRVVGRFRRAIRQHRIEVLHAHQYTPFFYAALAKATLLRPPRLVLTEHGRHYPDVVSPRRRLVNRALLARLADRVNAVCAFSADALGVKDGFDRARIEVVPNGVDLTAFDPPLPQDDARARAGLPAGRRFITCIARFHPVKDHHTLLAAFARVAARVPDADLLLAGDGPLRDSLVQQAGALGVGDRVRFLGIRRDVPELLRASDAFALTSVSEAASLTVLEAMAAGVPIVLTDVGGNGELVRAGIDGLLAPRGDAASIAAALERVLTDPALAARLGASASARARAEFRLDDTVARYEAIYRALA